MSMPELRVLVVDDHEDNLALLKMILESRSLGYLGATDGFAGLELARDEHPDLILLDLEMPGMDGFTMLEALKANGQTRDIPVIILTATYLEPRSVERGLSLGADEYLTKPINPEELLVRIRSVIRVRKAERELNQLRKDFTSMLVHDLRSPLEGVGIALNLCLTQELPEKDARQLVSMARDQVLELSQLIGDLLELHRAESGLALVAEPMNPAYLLTDVINECELVARDRHLKLECVAPHPMSPVNGDRRILKRVLVNLLSNALKFTVEGGVVLRALPQGDVLRIEVEDTGPGIPPAELDRIFDKYFHIKRRKEKPEHGFGLGLAFCKAAIEEHGGRIGVSSELGRGSTFWLELPLSQNPTTISR